MKLAQAMARLREPRPNEAEPYCVYTVCGFTSQHLRTFLAAHLLDRAADRRVTVEAGELYGDLVGNLAAAAGVQCDAVAVFLEWADLDPRLGYRTTHGWRPECERDFLDTSTKRLLQIREWIERLAGRTTVCVALPTLPLPPAFASPTLRGNAVVFALRERLAAFAAAISSLNGVCTVDPQCVDRLSPLDGRLDLGSDIRAGFPYTLEHASSLCRIVSELLVPSQRKKGIITDLDDTLWRGLLGEDGLEGISWDLSRGTHAHALYQEMLASVAASGTLVAAATKNEPALVEQALCRSDLVISRDTLFPVQAGWGPKSESVRRILEVWNIGADAAIFIDDSPLEIAEVSAAWPEMRCIRFPTRDDRAVGDLLHEVRDLCGTPSIAAEDRFRASSIRASSRFADGLATDPDEFLRSIHAEISLVFGPPDDRAFELINKTNQFNLNGRRLDDAARRAIQGRPDRFFLSVSYRDKFGPLGKIAVVSGVREEAELLIDFWVMSCRAFSRRIEFQTLKTLLERFGVEAVRLDLAATNRNGPFHEFVGTFVPTVVDGPIRIAKPEFLAKCPGLYAGIAVE